MITQGFCSRLNIELMNYPSLVGNEKRHSNHYKKMIRVSEIVEPESDNLNNKRNNDAIITSNIYAKSQLNECYSKINELSLFCVDNRPVNDGFVLNSATDSDVSAMNIQEIIALSSFLRVSLLSSINKILKKEIERVTLVQSIIRDKRVDLYQKQIVKSIDEGNKIKASNIFSLLVDWVVGVAETVYGCVKFLGSLASGDPLGASSSVAYIVAGIAGVVKSVAETVSLAIGDSKVRQEIISISNRVQMISEGMAVAIDLFQAGKLAIAARASIKEGTKGITEASTKALSELLDSAGESIAHDVGIESMDSVIQSVSHQIAEDITEEICQNITNRLTHGEVDIMEMTELTSSGERASVETMGKVEKNEMLYSQARREVIKKLGEKIGEPNRLSNIIEESVTETIRNTLKKSISAGSIDNSVKDTVAIIQDEINNRIIKKIISDYFCSKFQILRRGLPAAKKIVSGITNCEVSGVNAEVSKLIVFQDFETFTINWLEKQSKERELSRIKDGVAEISNIFRQLNDIEKSNSLLSINVVMSIV
ncbi:MAG: type III secretion system translocon subunit SctE [Plesiomonas sp.]|uniref:type III secretion system translocon subunit SctE n=1 Tax=Plesiomonas sp. TaxID=2486279 RepID=UPI003F35454A